MDYLKETSINYTNQSNTTSCNSQTHRWQPKQPKWHFHTFHLSAVFCAFSSLGVRVEVQQCKVRFNSASWGSTVQVEVQQCKLRFNSARWGSTVQGEVQQCKVWFNSARCGSTVQVEVQQCEVRFNSARWGSTVQGEVQQCKLRFNSARWGSTVQGEVQQSIEMAENGIKDTFDE